MELSPTCNVHVFVYDSECWTDGPNALWNILSELKLLCHFEENRSFWKLDLVVKSGVPKVPLVQKAIEKALHGNADWPVASGQRDRRLGWPNRGRRRCPLGRKDGGQKVAV